MLYHLLYNLLYVRNSGCVVLDQQTLKPVAGRRLRSASSTSLDVRHTHLSTVGDRVFPVAAARLWNSIPSHVTALSFSIFCCRLKPEFGDSAVFRDSRRIRRLSPKMATVAEFGNCRQKRRLSPIADFGDKLSPISATNCRRYRRL